MNRIHVFRVRRLRGRSAALAFLLGALTLLAAAPASARLYVSLTFDDGLRSQWDNRDVLDALGVKATYYVNSGALGSAGAMTWDELRALQAAGHEIGGHTIDHARLTDVSAAERQRQICDDRSALLAQGLGAADFAYPFGAQDAAVRATVAGCGYASGRTSGGLDEPPDCCTYADTVPPQDPFAARAFQVRTTTPIEEYRQVVALGRDHGCGWIPFVFHDVCTGACVGWNEYAVRRELLQQFVAWLRADPQIRVRTTAQVLAIPGDRTAPAVDLAAPADGASVALAEPVRLRAGAADAAAVDRVDFSVRGRLVASDDTAPYEAVWTADALGPAAVQAVAVDDAGNVGSSPTRTVTVRDANPSSPAPVGGSGAGAAGLPGPDAGPRAPGRGRRGPALRLRARVGRGGRVVATVLARDAAGVRAVVLRVNGRAVRTGVTRTRSRDGRRVRLVHSWTARPGRYRLVAVATDRRGDVTRTGPVRVVVRG